MIDGGAILIVFIAGLRYTIVSGTRLLITPQKKLDRLDKALDEANKIYDIALAKGVVPAATQVTLSTTQDDIIDAIYRLDKTRWGHLKNRREYKRIKKLVIVHCNDVKEVSRKCLSKAKVEAAQERVANEVAEQAMPQEEEATRQRLQSLDEDLSVLVGRKWRKAFGLLDASNTSLPVPVMKPQPYASQPDTLSSQLDGFVLDEDLIDLSDTPIDLSQRDGILIDLSTDDAGSLHRLFSSDSDIDYLEGMTLLSTLLDTPNPTRVPTEVSHPNETPISSDSSTPASEQSSENQDTSRRRRFGSRLNSLAEGIQMASSCISASSGIYGAIADAC